MRISDWSSDVCSSDLVGRGLAILDKGPDRRIEIEVNQRAPEEGESGRFGPAIGARVDGVAGGGIVVIMVRCDQSSPVGRPGDFPPFVQGRAGGGWGSVGIRRARPPLWVGPWFRRFSMAPGLCGDGDAGKRVSPGLAPGCQPLP